MQEKSAVKLSFRLIGEQADVLHDFLAVDNGQPPFGGFGLQLIIPYLVDRFYIFWGDEPSLPCSVNSINSIFVEFCSWL